MSLPNTQAPDPTSSVPNVPEPNTVDSSNEIKIYNPLTRTEMAQFDPDPFMQKFTNVLGWVEIFAPNGESKEWKDLPWLIKAERDGSARPYADNDEFKPLKIEISAAHVHDSYERPHFVAHNLHWQYIGRPVPDAVPEMAGMSSTVDAAPSPDLSGLTRFTRSPGTWDVNPGGSDII